MNTTATPARDLRDGDMVPIPGTDMIFTVHGAPALITRGWHAGRDQFHVTISYDHGDGSQLLQRVNGDDVHHVITLPSAVPFAAVAACVDGLDHEGDEYWLVVTDDVEGTTRHLRPTLLASSPECVTIGCDRSQWLDSSGWQDSPSDAPFAQIMPGDTITLETGRH